MPAEGEAEGERVYVGRAVRIALELAMLTLQRRTEIAAMRRDELALEQGVWTIQGDRTKNDAAHLVPLPERALALVREAVELSDDADNPSPFVFPSPRSRLKPISGGALTHALGDIYAALGIEGATVHDLRRTGATAMASERLGVLPFVVSRVLNHKSDTGGGAAVTAQVYNVHQYAAEKRTALTAWEGLLLEIVGERRKQVNVTQLRA
jgi:integrase